MCGGGGIFNSGKKVDSATTQITVSLYTKDASGEFVLSNKGGSGSLTINGNGYGSQTVTVGTSSSDLQKTVSLTTRDYFWISNVTYNANSGYVGRYVSDLRVDQFVAATCHISIIFESNHDNWSTKGGRYLSNGNGDKSYPYTISTAKDLATLISLVNAGNTFEGKYIVQQADINLGAYDWYPIGDSDTAVFKGHYDGGNHKIEGLYSRFSGKYAGLFGHIKDAEIKNLSITSGYINSSAKADTLAYTGSFVAYAEGSSSLQNLSSNLYIQCGYGYASSTGNAYTGGICGYNLGGDIENCMFTGSVIASGGGNGYGIAVQTYSGGIAGYNSGDITMCQVNAPYISAAAPTGGSFVAIAGGICGTNTSTGNISLCIVQATIYAGGPNPAAAPIAINSGKISDCIAGGICCLSSNRSAVLFSGTTTNCCFVGDIRGAQITAFSSSGVSGCYVSTNSYKSFSGGDFSGWSIVDNFNNGLPVQNNLFAIAPGGFTSEQIIEHLSSLGYKAA